MPMILKKCRLILFIEGCKKFIKNLLGLKKVSPQTKNSNYLKEEILDKAGDLFSELYYIYKER